MRSHRPRDFRRRLLPGLPSVPRDALGATVGAIANPTLTGVNIPAGTTAAGLQTLVNANANGTSFYFDAATYSWGGATAGVQPKTGQSFSAPPGTIIDGGGVAQYAFYAASGGPSGITIQNITFRNFASTGTSPALATVKAGDSWIVQDCDIGYNVGLSSGANGIGVWIGNNSIIRRNYIHHNDHYGLDGGGNSGAQIINNDIGWNNSRHKNNGSFDGGGTKFAHGCADLTIQYNWSHNNGGAGLWTDGDGLNITYDSNLVELNDFVGIDHEVSWEATITNNIVRYNGAYYISGTLGRIYDGSDISIGTSGASPAGTGITVSGNTVTSFTNGIGVIDADRGNSTIGPNTGTAFAAKGVHVHDNTVTLLTGGKYASGLAGRAASYLAGADNVWATNTYHTPDATSAWWYWNSAARTKTQWQSTDGQDTAGTFLTP